MKTNQISIPLMIKRFFSEYLPLQRGCSPHTSSSYAESFSLFLKYLQRRTKKRPESITIDELSSENVLGFLKYLQTERGNSDQTRNARLAAIHSFIKFLLIEKPALAGHVQGALSIPTKKTKRKVLDYLSEKEVEAILDATDTQKWCGKRDRALFTLMYNTGARVSEIVELKVSNVQIEAKSGVIRFWGKGRKERMLPLWKSTIQILRQWINSNRYDGNTPLFPNNRGGKMTRSAVTKRLDDLAKKAEVKCPSLKKQKVSPHIIRHSTAMHLLQSGVDITGIAQWLGHESIETTHIYIASDMKMKEKALGALHDPKLGIQRFQPKGSLLEFLENV